MMRNVLVPTLRVGTHVFAAPQLLLQHGTQSVQDLHSHAERGNEDSTSRRVLRVFRVPLLLFFCFVLNASSFAEDSAWPKIERHFQPPPEFAKDFGPYRSPLKFNDGTEVKTAEDWVKRRKEITDLWHKRLGSWPPLLEKPKVEILETKEKEGYTQKHVHVQVSVDGKIADGYLLTPKGKGPFPAVFVPFYEPLPALAKGKRATVRTTTACSSSAAGS